MAASRNAPLPSIRLHDAKLSQVAQLHVPEGLPGADDRGVCRRGTAGQHTPLNTPFNSRQRHGSVIEVIGCYLPGRPSLGRRQSCGQKDRLGVRAVLVQPSLLPFVPSLCPHTHPFCPALGALLLNWRLSFCLNLGGAALAPSALSTAAFMPVATGRRRINEGRPPFNPRQATAPLIHPASSVSCRRNQIRTLGPVKGPLGLTCDGVGAGLCRRVFWRGGAGEVVQNKEKVLFLFAGSLSALGLSPPVYIPAELRPKAANGVMSIFSDKPLREDTACRAEPLLAPPVQQV